MRLPKFRILNNKNNWVFFSVFHNGIDTKDFKKETLSEFTGLFDKQDVEIYESDIVKLIGTIGATTTIEFIDGAFYVVGYGLVSDWISEDGEWNNIEKLGNIWENPELLKAKS